MAATKLGQGRDQSEFASAVAPGALWRHVRWMAVAGPRWMAVAGPRWMAVAPGALWRMGARWMEAGALRRGRETVR